MAAIRLDVLSDFSGYSYCTQKIYEKYVNCMEICRLALWISCFPKIQSNQLSV